MTQTTVIHAAFPIDPAHREEAMELISELVEASNREEGVIEYRATTDVADENLFRFFERYESAEAFEAHGETEHFERFEERLPALLAGEPEVVRFEVSEATELEL